MLAVPINPLWSASLPFINNLQLPAFIALSKVTIMLHGVSPSIVTAGDVSVT